MEWWHEYILGPTNRVLSHARHWQASKSLYLYHLVFWALLSDRLVDWSIDTVLLPFFTWEILQKVSCLQLTSVIWSHGPWQLLRGPHSTTLLRWQKVNYCFTCVHSQATYPSPKQSEVVWNEVRWSARTAYWKVGKMGFEVFILRWETHDQCSCSLWSREAFVTNLQSQVIMSLSTPSLPTLSIVICHLHLFRDTTRSDSYCQGHQKKNYCRLIEGFPSKPRCPS